MKIINFKIKSKKNEVYQEGYVEIPDDVEESADWFYYNQTGMTQSRPFTHHDGVGLTLTEEQNYEIEQFKELVQYELVDWVNNVILNAEENEQGTYEKGDIIIQINEE